MEAVKNDLSKFCASCPHWQFLGNDNSIAIGECRFNPPQLILMPAEHKISHQVTMIPRAQFAQIVGTGWCAKHPARQAIKET